uniref:MICOS complex subunit MIC10 n=1 Tax=Haplochromis burtoni TaxID=8153 RepID=A0A3Q3CHA8_HAPBU
MSHVTSCFSREIFLTAENMADEHARKWDRCLADTAVKTVTGLGVGIVFSLIVFKRKYYFRKPSFSFLFFSFLSKPSNRDYFSPLGRAWPLSFGSGLGLGMGYSNCQHDFRSPYLIHGRMVKVSAQCNFHCLSEVCDTRSHHAA